MTLTQINKAGLDDIALDHVFTIGALGNASAYTFQGEGLNGTVQNPTLYLTRGKTYRFENISGGHPIRIQSTAGINGTAYNTGVTNNAQQGTVIVEVQHDAPDILYYQCTIHSNMNGILYITGALADGGVTTAKIAAGAVTVAKIGAWQVQPVNIQASAIGDSKIASNAVTTAKITDDAVTTAKIANDAVTQVKIAANAVDTTELAVGAVTHDQLADNTVDADHLQSNAVTTAKITANAVTTAKITDNAVTHAKYQDIPTSRILGRTSSGTGDVETLDDSTVRAFLGVSAGANQTTINNNADNRVITGSGTANTLNGESGLSYNGQFLVVDGSSNDNPLQLDTSNGNGAHMRFLQNGSTKHYLGCGGGISMGNANQLAIRSTDHIHFATGNSSSIKASFLNGGGLSFNGDTAQANAIDDYEEGTWTPTVQGPGGTGTHGAGNAGFYTKIGNVVHAHATIHWTAISGTTNGVVVVLGLPYATKNASHYRSTSLMGGQVVGFHNGANAAMNIGIGVDANQSFAYITGINGASTSSYNYTHQPTVNSTGHVFGFALTYLT